MDVAPKTQTQSQSQGDKLKRTNSNSGFAKPAAAAAATKPVMEIISEHFSPFDADALIVRPFEEEAARDAKFEEELSDMLLNIILKTHAWAASRPKHEAGLESRKLEEEISQIMDTEREQGMCSPTPSSSFSSSSFGSRVIEQTRQRLGEFVQRMKTAVAALMGVP
ncbi:hypothetical protein BDN70DRAFT_796593 [Pholiota conissans]|uniref:Uncharacterized protein n=1 Tax=Pholiota conissans TaxID=109636 RepID=A0A9P5ZBJ6_9AGAR|nr:hypothetical protein BDN70DRAFT_796593 [Pholiota conissans]